MTARACDVVVVGAGAAGMMASIESARRGRRTVLLEKNARPGLKIRISGGGRCNLTTTRGGRDLEEQYGRERGRWLRHALRAFPPAALRARIEQAGVPLQEEDLEKVFPVSGRAQDVVDALVGMVAAAGAELVGAAAMIGLERRADGRLEVVTAQKTFVAESVVLASGGLSYPKTGTTGDGYAVLQALGHGLVPPVPALAPLPIDAPWLNELAGVTLTEAELAVRPRGGKVLCRRARPILITHKGLSGPAPMDLSGYVEERGGGCELVLDLVPGVTPEQVEAQWLEAARVHGRRHAALAIATHVPERVRRALARRAGADVPAAELSRERRRAFVGALKETVLPVERSLGFAHAEVTRGGVPLREVDAKTMRSKVVEGVFVCGELLDVDGPIGGFNFQAAFATGWVAGQEA